jgi:hypothetical protein
VAARRVAHFVRETPNLRRILPGVAAFGFWCGIATAVEPATFPERPGGSAPDHLGVLSHGQLSRGTHRSSAARWSTSSCGGLGGSAGSQAGISMLAVPDDETDLHQKLEDLLPGSEVWEIARRYRLYRHRHSDTNLTVPKLRVSNAPAVHQAGCRSGPDHRARAGATTWSLRPRKLLGSGRSMTPLGRSSTPPAAGSTPPRKRERRRPAARSLCSRPC